MAAPTIKVLDGAVWITGAINEFSDFSAVPAGLSPLRLNLSQVTGMNSSGVREFIGFVAGLGQTPVAYVDCSWPMVETMLMIPSLLGGENQTVRIESLACPYRCAGCDADVTVMVAGRDIQCREAAVGLPPQRCPTCRRPLTAAEIASEFANFFALGALGG